jgi:hypothetical protein
MPKYKVGDVIKSTTTGFLITIKRIDDHHYWSDWEGSSGNTHRNLRDSIETLELYLDSTSGVLLTPRVTRRLPDWW